MNRRTAKVLGTLICLTVLLGAASAASACPSCQTALGNDSTQGDLARGIYYSILFMMAMPFAIVGTFGGLAYRVIKREQRRQAEQKSQDASDSVEK